MENINKNIRNFCILSHIDHGKSTLADRFLELTGTVSQGKMSPQFLDTMDLERERGITIKMQPVRMEYKGHILNLIDTPGHVDFSYEVSRSLAAVEGVVLLVDASKGIQAQTLANLELAKKQNLVIIPAVNKIDLIHSRVEETVQEMAGLLKIAQEDILKISAKNGTNIEQALEAIINKIPSPSQSRLFFRKGGIWEGKTEQEIQKQFRALIFDSDYNDYQGVIAYVRIVEGEIEKSEKIKLLATETLGEVKELGYFKPEFFPQKKLSAGEIGYIATGIKEPGRVRVGDTIVQCQELVRGTEIIKPLPGYQEPKPMVFASLYPENPTDFDLFKKALSKLKLSDPSLIFEMESKEALGRGFRCGFLGTLHAEIISERLKREFDLNLIISSASVIYKVNGEFIHSVSDWPEGPENIEEPWFFLEVVTPGKYLGKIFESVKGNYIGTKYLGKEKIILTYEIPLREIIANLYDKIKSLSQGFASMNYKFLEYRKGDLVKMDVLIAGEKESAFSRIVPRINIFQEGRSLVEKLKQVIPAQQFSVALQAAVGGKVIARETIKAKRKDVTGYLYGGDYTRKRKLLEKQKKGKKLLKEKGMVHIPPETYLNVFRS